MRVSTKGRYGLRIILELARHYNKNLLTVKQIAEKQEISEKYIEQIISLFNKAGMVRSQRGASGGYRLVDAPADVTVGDVLRVTEGKLQIVECTVEDSRFCKRWGECVTVDVWREVRRAVLDVVDNITIADLVERSDQKCDFNALLI